MNRVLVEEWERKFSDQSGTPETGTYRMWCVWELHAADCWSVLRSPLSQCCGGWTQEDTAGTRRQYSCCCGTGEMGGLNLAILIAKEERG